MNSNSQIPVTGDVPATKPNGKKVVSSAEPIKRVDQTGVSLDTAASGDSKYKKQDGKLWDAVPLLKSFGRRAPSGGQRVEEGRRENEKEGGERLLESIYIVTPRVGLTKLQIGESGLGSVYTTINDPTRGDSHSTPLTVAVKILKQLSQQTINIIDPLFVVKEAQAMVSSGSVIAQDHLLTRRTSTLSWKLRPEIMFVIYIDFMTIIYIRNHRTLVWLEKVPKELIPCYNRNRETGPTAVQRCI
ncbi:hypothetical protein IGI04_006307 [Brassica rapa subsp. trilocularis]|uniref:Protein kinase domain-containing protein n=1 Tax=Brassica rapa subsp. trilocularis TaxID=1813537 RepID=A0ABQ7NGJ2_BRACM|nr:hypothetical protein IGI04_006307 [Brassica rapa subsp. trilocularis]